MTQQNPSQESCTTCTQSSQTASDVPTGQTDAVTYDEGNGIKSNVVIDGPLSQAVAQILNTVFKKQEFQIDPSSPELAAESHAQDVAIQEAFHAVSNQPDNQVILSQFDVKSIKDHMDSLKAGRFTNEELKNTTPINVVAITPEDALDPIKMMDYCPNGSEEMLLVVKPVPGSTDDEVRHDFIVRDPALNISQVLRTEPDTVKTRLAKDEPSVADKIAAVERLYGDQFKHIHVGVQAFVTSLGKRVSAK